MTQVPQELIEKLAARGIVPGARCRSAVTDKEEVLPPYGRWSMRGYDELVFAEAICLYGLFSSERFATVIEPAPGVKPDGLGKEDECAAIVARILEEHRKHAHRMSPDEWVRTTAHNIAATLREMDTDQQHHEPNTTKP